MDISYIWWEIWGHRRSFRYWCTSFFPMPWYVPLTYTGFKAIYDFCCFRHDFSKVPHTSWNMLYGKKCRTVQDCTESTKLILLCSQFAVLMAEFCGMYSDTGHKHSPILHTRFKYIFDRQWKADVSKSILLYTGCGSKFSSAYFFYYALKYLFIRLPRLSLY